MIEDVNKCMLLVDERAGTFDLIKTSLISSELLSFKKFVLY